MLLRHLPLATLAVMLLAPLLPGQDADGDHEAELLRHQLLQHELQQQERAERAHAALQRERAEVEVERAQAAEGAARYREVAEALQRADRYDEARHAYDLLAATGAGERARLDMLLALGMVDETRPMIGITTRAVDEGLSQHLGVHPDEVLMIAEVMEGMPAEAAGLRPHDIVLSVNGIAPVNLAVLREAITEAGDGGEIAIELLRDGNRAQLIIGVRASEVGQPGTNEELARRMLQEAEAAQVDARRRVDLEEVLAQAQRQMSEQRMVQEDERASVLEALARAQAELALSQRQEAVERDMRMAQSAERRALLGQLSLAHDQLLRQLNDNEVRSADLRDRMSAVLESGHPDVAADLGHELGALRGHAEELHAELAELTSRLDHERSQTAYLGALGAGRTLMLPSAGSVGGKAGTEQRLNVIDDRLAGIEDRLAHLTELIERLVPHERDR